MKLMNIKRWILTGAILHDKRIAVTLWFGLSFILVCIDYVHHSINNNYVIFKYVYIHTVQQVNLFLEYPAQYSDVNLYGPVFSLVIAPFSILPDQLGIFCWVMFNAGILFYAIRQLPVAPKWQYAILILSSHEMMNCSSYTQSNALIAACIILGFVLIQAEKEIWALLFIMLATMIKLYGIVGFAFFFFSNHKWKFAGWAFFWTIVFFILPMFISSRDFIIQSYYDWFDALQFKAVKNINPFIHNDFQDISVMGMIRRIFGIYSLKNYIITLPAVLLFLTQYLQWEYFKDLRFRLYMLCLVLLMTVIFTTSAESPTYIIAFPAVCIWFVMQPSGKWVNTVFIFALLLTSFSYSDLFTPFLREKIIRPYSLKALPCFVLWLIILIQLWRKQFLKINLPLPNPNTPAFS